MRLDVSLASQTSKTFCWNAQAARSCVTQTDRCRNDVCLRCASRFRGPDGSDVLCALGLLKRQWCSRDSQHSSTVRRSICERCYRCWIHIRCLILTAAAATPPGLRKLLQSKASLLKCADTADRASLLHLSSDLMKGCLCQKSAVKRIH